MWDDHVDPGIAHRARFDQGEHGPDVRVRLTPDVLPGARPKRVVERRLRRIDEEVDGLRLLHPEQVRGLLHALLPHREGLLGERVRPLVPVKADERARDRLPGEPGIRVEDADRGALHRGAGHRGDPPARDDRRVRHEVAVRRLRPAAAQGQGTAAGRDRDLVDERPERRRERDEQLDALDRAADRHRLDERHARPEDGARRRGAKRDIGGLDGEHTRPEHESERNGDRDYRAQRAGRGHGVPSAHAIPAIRRIPRPFVCAPRRPVRLSA